MHPFEHYMKENNLEALTVAVTAKVRYLTVYNAMKGYPISLRDAETIRQIAFRLSGVAYRGVFATHIDEQPTVPLKRILIKSS